MQKNYHVNAVNVEFCWAELIVEQHLQASDVGPSAVVGFPYGAMSTKSKLFELQEMVDLDAQHALVINIGAVRDGNWDLVRYEVSEFVRICGDKCDTKLIFEVGFLTDEEIAKLTQRLL